MEVWVSRDECDRLNERVCELFLSGDEDDACDAIHRVICTERMMLIEGSDEDRVELYAMPSGKLVTVWWGGVGVATREEWEQASVGFDVDTGLHWTTLGRQD